MTDTLTLTALFAALTLLLALRLTREPDPDTGFDDAAPWITWRSGYSDEDF
jgi:hypothetical protein